MPIVSRFGLPRSCWAALVLAAVPASDLTAADARTGEQIYRQMCVRCHGTAGEGTKKAPQPLTGDKSVDALAKLIDRTMPEGDPDQLDAAGSAAVAAYIHAEFYSSTAQARLKPARVELSRLTVAQYRNAVADLVGTFRGTPKADDRRGLRGEYFASREFQNDKRVIDRVDPEVRFDFGTAGPGPDKFDPHQFAIRWEGSVLPPESGTYEFVVRTEHAVKLWVNDHRTPLIDAWVKSGADTEYRASIPLLAGRPYPLRMEFSKAKQGVDDSKTNKNKPIKPASVALLWKPPHGATGVIPARHLSPGQAAEVFVSGTAFPPDDRSLGWERGTAVSKEWDAATTEAAFEVAGYVTGRLRDLAGVRENTPDRAARLRDFGRRFAERAFRRPLTDDQKKLYVDRHFDAADPDTAVKRVVLVALKSPLFLYREVGGGSTPFDTACRLSFTLWDAPPDDELVRAASSGKLATPDQLAAQAERMLADPRARAKVRAFLFTWLRLDQAHDLTKDPKRFPAFTPEVAADLRTSLDLFLDDVVWSPGSDFRQLLTSDTVYLNDVLAKMYGAKLPDGTGFRKATLDPGKRAGVLTHPYILATFAYTGESSPIHRGVFVARGVLGLTMRPPPEAVTPLPVDLHPTLTTRERVTLQTGGASCVSCHGVINPLGFTLERFDAIGKFRDTDHGKPVDPSGGYQTRAGAAVAFADAPDLARFLAGSEEVHAAFTAHLFHALVKQPIRAYGPGKPDELRSAFAAGGFNVRKLIVKVAVTAALPTPPDPNPPKK